MNNRVINKSLVLHVVDIYRENGAIYIFSLAWLQLKLLGLRLFGSRRTFNLGGDQYTYYYHSYNRTWMNERAVEISIIRTFVQRNPPQNILEVGNVLSHYFPTYHDVLDKYEIASGVINEDVVQFEANKKYDLIVSISTLEHVGWDENPKDSTKIIRAIENLKRCLAEKGTMVATLPVGYNQYLDTLLIEEKIKFTREFFLKRISEDNEWVESDRNEVLQLKYGDPYPGANGLVIGIIESAC